MDTATLHYENEKAIGTVGVDAERLVADIARSAYTFYETSILLDLVFNSRA